MKFLLAVAALLAVAHGAVVQEVCFDDLGCFNTGPPFSAFGRVALLPDNPKDLDTRFYLYTRANTDQSQELRAHDKSLLAKSSFSGAKSTKFIAHGWIDGSNMAQWQKDMARQFLLAEDCNAIVVDWHGGSRRLYGQSVANTRVIGAQIAQLVKFLVDETGVDVSKMHILGHSLGSHVAGYAGERIPNLGRITGMDPADPYFQNMSREVRLDETDANFVDIIHTDANDIFTILNIFNNMNGMGLWQPSGHVDVYPNGGKKQPGCGDKGPINQIISNGIVEGMRYTIACAHMRGYDYALESIASSCPWRSYHCPGGYDEFQTGRCLRCPNTGDKTVGCNGVGYVATKPSDGSVNNMFYMVTGDKSPFCRYHWHIQLVIKGEKNKDQKGKVWVKLFGETASTGFIQLGTENFYIKKGSTYDFLITTKEDIREVKGLELKWEHDAAFYEISQWHITKPTIFPGRVNVFSGEYQAEKKFCDNNGELKSKSSRQLSAC